MAEAFIYNNQKKAKSTKVWALTSVDPHERNLLPNGPSDPTGRVHPLCVIVDGFC
ncbi:hypothetical protein SAMN05444162_3265 [Paenibacillaceae bacterium GAS479]|nr:hypothetical protein SAMN05444162_3265 [Paenibacillaceae bacterium GAS479]